MCRNRVDRSSASCDMLRSSCVLRKHPEETTTRGALLHWLDCGDRMQATELSTLVPLALGCKRLILVGDPRQLPATVISQRAARYRRRFPVVVLIVLLGGKCLTASCSPCLVRCLGASECMITMLSICLPRFRSANLFCSRSVLVRCLHGVRLNMEVSLFERLERAGYPVHMLTVQYRMHPEIRQFPSGEIHVFDVHV